MFPNRWVEGYISSDLIRSYVISDYICNGCRYRHNDQVHVRVLSRKRRIYYTGEWETTHYNHSEYVLEPFKIKMEDWEKHIERHTEQINRIEKIL